MATTNFLQWNPAQVNQETDAEYLADSQRVGGAPNGGLAPSETMNKFYYQASTFVAAFGQMLAAKGYTNSDADISVLQAVLSNLLTDADLPANLVAVAYSPTPVFPAAAANGFAMTLTGDITASTITGVSPGQLLAFYFTQDGVGGRAVSWPAGFVGALQPDPAPNAVSLILFRADLGSVPRALGPLMSNNGVFFGTLTAQSITLASGAPVGATLVGNGTSFIATAAPTRGQFTLPAGSLGAEGQHVYDTGIAVSGTAVVAASIVSGTINAILTYAVTTEGGTIKVTVSNTSSVSPGYGSLTYNYVIL